MRSLGISNEINVLFQEDVNVLGDRIHGVKLSCMRLIILLHKREEIAHQIYPQEIFLSFEQTIKQTVGNTCLWQVDIYIFR